MNLQLVLGCMHVPFHNKKMWKGVLKLIKDIKPQGINLIGDILDMNAFSFHERGKIPIIDAKTEYKLASKFFDEIDDAIGRRKIEKRFLFGNHEDRYLRHQELPDNKKILIQSPIEEFRLVERGYEIKTRWKEDYFTLGDHLEIFHGSLLGVNPAKTQLDKLKKSCMFAHSHRAGVYYDGKMASYNIGWGGDIYAEAFNYAPRLTKRNWVNGFGIVALDKNGDYFAQVITLYNNKFVYNGKEY